MDELKILYFVAAAIASSLTCVATQVIVNAVSGDSEQAWLAGMLAASAVFATFSALLALVRYHAEVVNNHTYSS